MKPLRSSALSLPSSRMAMFYCHYRLPSPPSSSSSLSKHGHQYHRFISSSSSSSSSSLYHYQPRHTLLFSVRRYCHSDRITTIGSHNDNENDAIDENAIDINDLDYRSLQLMSKKHGLKAVGKSQMKEGLQRLLLSKGIATATLANHDTITKKKGGGVSSVASPTSAYRLQWHNISSDDFNASIDHQYHGPRLTYGQEYITIDFAKELMNYFMKKVDLKSNVLPKVLVRVLLDSAIGQHEGMQTVIDLPNKPIDDSNCKSSTMSICGDTHGQFYDFCQIFSNDMGGFPSADNMFLFNGDFVDRGKLATEILLTLISIKLACPCAMYMLRGNHETTMMNEHYGFKGECMTKYDAKILQQFRTLFRVLPVAAVIPDVAFIVHGGLGVISSAMTVKELAKVKRNFDFNNYEKNSTNEKIISELLWSDPSDAHRGFSKGPRGGQTTTFGPDVTKSFLEKNRLQMLIRSHEVRANGYSIEHDGLCVTVFSAPNYVGTVGNKGAFLRFDLKNGDSKKSPTVHIFNHTSFKNVK